MTLIEVTLKLCTLYYKVPYGPAIIQYTDKVNTSRSFEGVGLFTDGKLHDGPFTYVDTFGGSYSFALMKNGRPADGGFGSFFYRQGDRINVNSLTEKSDVSGWQHLSGQLSRNGFCHGIGKKWMDYG
jgi:hypothetical protein